MPGGVIQFNVGDLLIEKIHPVLMHYRPNGPRVAVALEGVDPGLTEPFTVILNGLIEETYPPLWEVLASTRDDLCNKPLPVVE
jgi:hypothetical protein